MYTYVGMKKGEGTLWQFFCAFLIQGVLTLTVNQNHLKKMQMSGFHPDLQIPASEFL